MGDSKTVKISEDVDDDLTTIVDADDVPMSSKKAIVTTATREYVKDIAEMHDLDLND